MYAVWTLDEEVVEERHDVFGAYGVGIGIEGLREGGENLSLVFIWRGVCDGYFESYEAAVHGVSTSWKTP